MLGGKVAGRVRGAGERLWAALPSTVRLPESLVLVDVGASKGLQPKWQRYRRSLIPVLFEPNPDEAAALRATLSGYAHCHVLDQGLSDRAGPHRLNIARYFGCSSMLAPNAAFLQDYAIAGLYDPVRSVEVDCCRYDTLVAEGKAPIPDVIKVDIEGFESRALAGFGDLLSNVLGVETEAWFYQAFEGQALLHDLVALLGAHGMRLRRLEQVPGFEGDLVCVNAFFTITRSRCSALSAAQRAKFELMSRVWGLSLRS